MQSKGKTKLGKIRIKFDLCDQINQFMRLFSPFVSLPQILLPLLLLFMGCTTEVDINAEPKDIWSVYGILTPDAPLQEIRIARGFLPEGNAEDAAAAEDFSVSGLNVVLRGDGKEWRATEVGPVPKDSGDFFPFTLIYQFDTEGTRALQPGKRYDLEITRPDDSEFAITSHTFIPEIIEFTRPTNTPGPGGLRCLRQISLDEDFLVSFSRGKAAGFEIRAFLDYTENGVAKTADFGPSELFTSSVRCRPEGDGACFQFRAKELLQAFFLDMNPNNNNVYTYGVNELTRCNSVPADLPDDFRLEVTAMDSSLTLYRTTNDPKFVDFNTVRREFTNIQGPGITVGILGSYITATAFGQLNQCSAYLLQLNNTPRPSSPCDL